MKLYQLLLAALAAVVSTLSAIGSDELTATELARHLDIHHWRSEVALPPGSFSVAMFRIQDGKKTDPLLGYLSAVDGCRLVILASSDRSGTKATIKLGSSSMRTSEDSPTPAVALDCTVPLPPSLSEGEYVLGGDFVKHGDTVVISRKIEDVISGLLLVVDHDPTLHASPPDGR